MPLAEPTAADETAFAGAIERPHPDIELGIKRTPLSFSARLPAAGINAETGFVIYLGGYGMDPRDGYSQSLLTYLADSYNCVAATLDYFGVRLLTPNVATELVPHPDFFTKLHEHYGLSITAPKGMGTDQILAGIAGLLAQNGVTHIHNECVLFNNSAEYNSMGFLPALDGLEVTHRLLKTLPLNRSRLFVLGTSYGAYIANIMAKLAPRTFRMIVDNSVQRQPADHPVCEEQGWPRPHLEQLALRGQRRVRSRIPRLARQAEEDRLGLLTEARPEDR